MLKAYRHRLYPTKEQEVLLAKHFGCVRFVYNKALELKTQKYQNEKESLSRFQLSKLITDSKKEEETKWLNEVNSQALQSAFLHLDTAFVKFFKKEAGYPKFKSKSNHQSFSCPQHCRIDFESSRFFCPKFKDGIKCVFDRKFEGDIRTCTVSKTSSGKYFVSILVRNNVEIPKPSEPEFDKCLGIDLGIKDFATFSDGTKIENPKFLNKKLKKLKRVSRQHSKKKKGSKNREKSRKKLAIQHEKVVNCRKDFQHKLSTKIADNQGFNCVAMETLNIKGMIKNRKLDRHIGDTAWYQFKTFLKYKLEQRGKTLLEIGQFEPSSKMCSCGKINNELTLKDRFWSCSCGASHDRDILAANNIKTFAFIGRGTPESTPLETCVSGSLKEEYLE